MTDTTPTDAPHHPLSAPALHTLSRLTSSPSSQLSSHNSRHTQSTLVYKKSRLPFVHSSIRQRIKAKLKYRFTHHHQLNEHSDLEELQSYSHSASASLISPSVSHFQGEQSQDSHSPHRSQSMDCDVNIKESYVTAEQSPNIVNNNNNSTTIRPTPVRSNDNYLSPQRRDSVTYSFNANSPTPLSNTTSPTLPNGTTLHTSSSNTSSLRSLSKQIMPSEPLHLRPVVASLCVRVESSRFLLSSDFASNASRPLGHQLKYHVQVSVETQSARTPVVRSASGEPHFNYSIDFALTDVEADVVCEVVINHLIAKDEHVGRIIVPLHRVITQGNKIDCLNNLLYRREFNYTRWFEVYPSDYECVDGLFYHRFPCAENRVPNTGLHKPKKCLGYLQLHLSLQLHHSLLFCLTQVKPLWFERQPIVEYPEFHLPSVRRNFKRLRRALNTAPYWFVLFRQQVVEWRSIVMSLISILLCYQVCFIAQQWHYPILIALFIAFCGICSAYYSATSHLVVWEEDAEPYEWLNERKYHKFKRYIGLLAKVAQIAGRISSVLEKCGAAINGAELYLSLLFYCAMFTLAVMSSLLLFIIPFNHLVFIVYNAILLNGLLAKAIPRWLYFAVKPTENHTLSYQYSPKSTTDFPFSLSRLRNCLNKLQIQTSSLATQLNNAIQSVYLRLPDNHIEGHRFVAESAVQPSTPKQAKFYNHALNRNIAANISPPKCRLDSL